MKNIILITCAAHKQDQPAPAGDLYTSSLFCKSLAYARRLAPDAIDILSAKHGLLPLDEAILAQLCGHTERKEAA